MTNNERMAAARDFAALPWANLAKAIASGECEINPDFNKAKLIEKNEEIAQEIREGKHDGNFTIAQRMETYLTGKCTPLLSV